MIELKFLGGASEVGRMGITLFNGTQRFLFEYGVSVERMDLPIMPDMPVEALFLSHAHLDHSGHIPSLYRNGWNGRVYATPATFDIANILLKDSMKVQKIQGMQPHYSSNDIKAMDSRGINMHFGKEKGFKTAKVVFHDAGHTPGSSSILMETDGKRVLFTGDIKFDETLLMEKAFTDFRDIDILITESTYSYKDHPPRMDTVRKLREKVVQTVNRGGFAILPCFAVGRTQEMLLAVSDLGLPVYLDGMGIRVTQAVLNNPRTIKDHKGLEKAFGSARRIRSQRQRKDAMKRPGIVITTAGMLNGGPVHYYIQRLINDEKSTIILSGFQVPETVGRILLDSGRYIYEDVDAKPKMSVEFADLSAHCGRSDLIRFIEKIRPEKTILVHGERTKGFAAEINSMGFDTLAPVNGEVIKL